LDQVLKTGKCDVIRRLPSSAVAYVDSALWPAWLRIALTEPVFLHFTTGARTTSSFDCPDRSLPVKSNPHHRGDPSTLEDCCAALAHLPSADGEWKSSGEPLHPRDGGALSGRCHALKQPLDS
jgi:hypothetical protein